MHFCVHFSVIFSRGDEPRLKGRGHRDPLTNPSSVRKKIIKSPTRSLIAQNRKTGPLSFGRGVWARYSNDLRGIFVTAAPWYFGWTLIARPLKLLHLLRSDTFTMASRRRRGGRLPPLTDAALVRADGRRLGPIGNICVEFRHVGRRSGQRFSFCACNFPAVLPTFAPFSRAPAPASHIAASRAVLHLSRSSCPQSVITICRMCLLAYR